jgi:hypothetical protein
MMKLQSLNDIQRLLPPKESIYKCQAEEAVREFMTRWQIKPRHFDDYNTMSSFLYANATSAKRLQAACTIHSMFFFIDDLFFDTDHFDARDFSIELESGNDFKSIGHFLADLMHIFRTGELPNHPSLIQQAFAEMRKEVLQQATAEWYEIFTEGIQGYITAVIQRETDLRRGNKRILTDMKSFLDIRLRDTGGLHTSQLIELTKNAFLPAELRNHEQIQYLTWLAIAMASLVNDIFSYHKDVVIEKSDFNLVKILMDTQKLSFDEAVHESVKIVNNYADLFVEQRVQLPVVGQQEDWIVKQYVDGLAEMMSGNVYWHASTNRYRSPDSPFVELQNLNK